MIKRAFIFLCLFISYPAFSLELELTKGVNTAMPIGVSTFIGGTQATQISDVIKRDLQLSGQFRLVNVNQSGGPPAISSWRSAGADSVLSGTVESAGNGKFDVKFQLFNAAAYGKLLLSKTYQVNSGDLRALAHHISDEVYEKLTGDKGVFSTRIAYILVKDQRRQKEYNLEVADFDGSNPQTLLRSSQPIMSPSWSPNGKQIAYVSFENKRAQIYTVNVETGRRRLITSFSGINGAPAWSPNGKELAVVLSKTGAPKLYTVNLSSGRLKQLTFGKSIDTEPRYAPDGKSILFTSGRGGSPQIYKLSLANGKVNRVTYDGSYNARASYTPNERNIVMLHREKSGFHIGVQQVGSSHIDSLTSSPMDESPSVSPNGRLVVYATKSNQRGVLAMVSLDGRIRLKLPSREGDVQEPAWSPFLG